MKFGGRIHADPDANFLHIANRAVYQFHDAAVVVSDEDLRLDLRDELLFSFARFAMRSYTVCVSGFSQ